MKENYESIKAFEDLKVIWFLRGFVDLIVGLSCPYFAYTFINSGEPMSKVLIMLLIGVFLFSELYFIVRFFQRKSSAIMALNVYSAFSILNFPIGTGFSVYHYLKVRDLEWD